MKKTIALGFLIGSFMPLVGFAQELYNDQQGLWKAEVVEISNERQEEIAWTETPVLVQTVRARILEGEREGDIVEFENDYIRLKEGDEFFLNYLVTIDGDEIYSVRDVDRLTPVYLLVGLFAIAVLALGGRQGLRSLLSLVGSLLATIYILMPALLAGHSPVLVSTAVATVVLFAAIYFTHGFKMSSSVAFAGTVGSVALTGLLAYAAVHLTRLTGFGSEDVIYLNMNTSGRLDLPGLLLGGIIIGVLGVLDDIAITQVAVVRELIATNPKLSPAVAYRKALRVGREHVSALVNTLVLAYAGAALPLLMLISLSEAGFAETLNQELVASEVVRMAVGSIGLILTVPITTALAAYAFTRPGRAATLAEEDSGSHSGHIHGHV